MNHSNSNGTGQSTSSSLDVEQAARIARRKSSHGMHRQHSIHRTTVMQHTLHKGTLRHRGSFLKALQAEDPEELLQNDDFVDAPSEVQAACLKRTKASLHEKKRIMGDLHREGHQKKAKFGCWERATWNLTVGWSNFKQCVAGLKYSLELWRSHIKQIEGHFGTGVTSYFRSLRQLFYLNIMLMIFIFGFITIPQILYHYFIQHPPGYMNNTNFSGIQLLTGGGWFTDTELYYGYYHNGPISVLGGVEYNMKYAYLTVLSAYYIITLIILIFGLSKSYRTHHIEESGAMQNFCIVKVLSGWDYKITSQKAALIQHSLLYQELQEYLVELPGHMDKQSVLSIIGMVLVRIITNIVVLAVLGGTGYLMWYITTTQSLTNKDGIISSLAMPLCVTAINLIIPFIFTLISYIEKYANPRVQLILNMLRTITLNLVTLGVLVYSWFRYAVDCNTKNGCPSCWENFIGKQIYSLVMFDFLFMLFMTLFSEVLYRFIAQRRHKDIEFNIAKNTLNLIYSQILVWLGTFYSPLLSVIHVIKLLILFYLKKVSVITNCAPPSKPWRAGQTSTFIEFLLLISFLLTFSAVIYGVALIAPSKSCGPYQSYNTTYQILEDLRDQWLASDEKKVIKIIMEIAISDAFRVYLLVFLAIAAYYAHVVADANEKKVKTLRNQIILEAKDKRFLLNLLHNDQTQQYGLTSQQRKSRNKIPSDNQTTPVSNNNMSSSQAVSSSQPECNIDKGDERREIHAAQRRQTMDIQNPLFTSQSTEELPNLPYSLRHYDILTG